MSRLIFSIIATGIEDFGTSNTVVLVVDFGGGTLDLSLIRTVVADNTKKVLRAQVLAKSDAYVGGVDIDVWIVEHYLRQINSSREEV